MSMYSIEGYIELKDGNIFYYLFNRLRPTKPGTMIGTEERCG